MQITDEQIKSAFKQIREADLYHATSYSCNGNWTYIDGIGGVKLISRPIKNSNYFYVADFVNDSYILEINGYWVGIQTGWPPTEEEFNKENEYDRLCIQINRRYPPYWKDVLLKDLMLHERKGYEFWNENIPSDWLEKAKVKFEKCLKYKDYIPVDIIAWFVKKWG